MALKGGRYNEDMNNVNSCNCNKTCTTCGRPWAVCNCNKVNFCEYEGMAQGCIRNMEPECPMQAVIPSVTVDDTSGMKNLLDCFVHVTSINTTFYIDNEHRQMITWAGPVEYDNYDLDANTLNLRNQFLIDKANSIVAYFDKTGKHQLIGAKEPLELTLTPADISEWSKFLPDFDQLGQFAWNVAMSKVEAQDGASYTAESVFNALETGEEIIFKNFPIGYIASADIDNVYHLTHPGLSTNLRLGVRTEIDTDKGHIVIWANNAPFVRDAYYEESTGLCSEIGPYVVLEGTAAVYKFTPKDGGETVYNFTSAGSSYDYD